MDFLDWVEGTWVAGALQRSGDVYMLVNAAHILGIGLIIGAIIPLDLRLLGFFRATPRAVIVPFLTRVAATGLALAILTGLALWSVRPGEYLANAAFRAKAILLCLAALNIIAQHFASGWSRVLRGGEPPAAVRVRAALSLALWLSVLLAGRWIGFL